MEPNPTGFSPVVVRNMTALHTQRSIAMQVRICFSPVNHAGILAMPTFLGLGRRDPPSRPLVPFVKISPDWILTAKSMVRWRASLIPTPEAWLGSKLAGK
jgi:hypothetical protein